MEKNIYILYIRLSQGKARIRWPQRQMEKTRHYLQRNRLGCASLFLAALAVVGLLAADEALVSARAEAPRAGPALHAVVARHARVSRLWPATAAGGRLVLTPCRRRRRRPPTGRRLTRPCPRLGRRDVSHLGLLLPLLLLLRRQGGGAGGRLLLGKVPNQRRVRVVRHLGLLVSALAEDGPVLGGSPRRRRRRLAVVGLVGGWFLVGRLIASSGAT